MTYTNYKTISEPQIHELSDDTIKESIKRSYPLLTDTEINKTLKEIRKNQFKGGLKNDKRI